MQSHVARGFNQGIEPRDDLEAGFSLIELVVGVVIMVVVLGSIYTLLEVGRSGRGNTLQRVEMLQNARVALNAMSRDAINAGVGFPNTGVLLPDNALNALGLSGEPDGDTSFDVLTPVYASDMRIVVGDRPTHIVTFAFLDDTFNGAEGVPVESVTIGETSVRLTIRAPFENTGIRAGDVFMVTGQNGYALVQVQRIEGVRSVILSSIDPLKINHPDPDVPSPLLSIVFLGASCGADCFNTTASLSRIRWVTYFLADDGSGTGSLIRRVYGGRNADGDPIDWEDQPLAYGLENLQLQYVLVDGRVVETPVRTADEDEMQSIRQIRLGVDVLSPDLDPKTNQPYRAQLSASFSTRNLVYEKN